MAKQLPKLPRMPRSSQPPIRITREMRALGYKLNTPNRRYEDKSGERDSVPFSEVEKFVLRTKGHDEPADEPVAVRIPSKMLIKAMIDRGFAYNMMTKEFTHPNLPSVSQFQARHYVDTTSIVPPAASEEKMSPRMDNLHKIAGGDVYLMKALERLRWEEKTRQHAMNYGMGQKLVNRVSQGDEQMAMGQDAEFYTPFSIEAQGGLWVELLEVDNMNHLLLQLPHDVPPAEFEEFVQKIKGRKDLMMQLLRMFFELKRTQQTVAREREKMMALNHQLDRAMKQEHNEQEKQRLQVLNSTGHLIEALAMMVGNMPTSR